MTTLTIASIEASTLVFYQGIYSLLLAKSAVAQIMLFLMTLAKRKAKSYRLTVLPTDRNITLFC